MNDQETEAKKSILMKPLSHKKEQENINSDSGFSVKV